MAFSKFLNFLVFFIILSVFQEQAFAVKKSYIVYLGAHSHGAAVTTDDLERVTDSHHEFLGSFLESKEHAREAIFYSYKRYINGFAAILEEEDAAKIAKHPDVVSVFPNQGRKLHTTHSWDFMMLEDVNGVVYPESLWRKANFGQDTIIANLDTGVWPESLSFSEQEYLGPVPSKWKGSCENATVPCNRKLIGAKYFNKGYIAAGGKLRPSWNSARDHAGHGSHTLSTAGGNFVPGANVLGVGNGTAKGGSPKARVASYKVCWPPIDGGSECFDSDILQAFDVAIHDGVDVISMSLGGEASTYFYDGIAIGAFHALKHNIVVVASAGNSGPFPGTVSNIAPWLITIGASTMDRKFQAAVELPNGLHLKGASLSEALPGKKFYPLINAADAKAANSSVANATLCFEGALARKKVEGKILVCLRGVTPRVEKGYSAALAGAVGMILCNADTDGNEVFADPHFLPAVQIGYKDGQSLYAYMNTNKNPKGYIVPPQTVLHAKPAPMMADFSSRGPNIITPEILKPDITAPGVDVLAAFSGEVSPTEEPYDKRRTAFTLMSGTSMSCPHISGIAGLLKTLHPDWSPAAIRSAIMTSARTRDNTKNPMLDGFADQKATPFDYGAGHVRPNRAMNPGLVYDLTITDHLDFLCAIGYNQTMIRSFSDGSYECPENLSLFNFNYPSISVPYRYLNGTSSPVIVTRTLKNVGSPGTYAARIRQPYGISVSVDPPVLKFKKIGEEKSFKLTLEAKDHRHITTDGFGELLWSDGRHYVRSPIAVAFPVQEFN